MTTAVALPESSTDRACVLAIGLRSVASRALASLVDVADVIEAQTLEGAATWLQQVTPSAVLVDARVACDLPTGLDALRARLPHATFALAGAREDVELVTSLSEGFSFRLLSLEQNEELFRRELQALVQPRTLNRRRLTSGWRVRARVRDRDFDHEACDISNRGLSFLVPAGASLDGFVRGGLVSALALHSPEAGLVLSLSSAVVRHCSVTRTAQGAAVRVGLSFEASFDPGPPHDRVLHQAHAVSASLRKALRAGASIILRRPDDETSRTYASGRIEGSPETLILEGAAPMDLAAYDVVRLAFELHGQSLSGLASVMAADADRVVLALPSSLRRHHRRGASRYRPTAARPFRLRLRNPLTGLDEVRAVLDIHQAGLSLAADLDRDLLPPGLVLGDIDVWLPDDTAPVSARAVVRTVTPLSAPSDAASARPARCGVGFAVNDEADAGRLARALITSGFPGIVAATPDDFRGIWDFLPEAGLSYHLYADHSALSERTIEDTFGKVLGAGDQVAINLIERSEGTIRGHIAGVRLARRTWLATHLAANTGGFRHEAQVSRSLCLAMLDHFESKPDFEYVKFFWKKGLRWPNRVFGWAGRGVAHTGLSELRELDLLVRELSGPLPEAPAGIEVTAPDADDLAWVESFLLGRCGHLRVDADDLTATGLELTSVAQAYARAGLDRRRLIRVARRQGTRVGVTLLELSTQGLQLNEFTSHFEVLTADDDDLPTRRALVADAVTVYRDQGRRHAVALSELSDTAAFLEAGFVSQTPFRALTLHRSLLRTYSDLLALLFQAKGFKDVSDS